MSRIIYLHRVPKKIVSDGGTQFTSKFWERLHETLDTQLRYSSAYHPQTDGQTERVNQILEDMLRACCHTQFLCQNRVLIVCMTHDQMFHTYGQKWSQITKCHNIAYNYYINNVFKD
jgi:transposase InsO family protein